MPKGFVLHTAGAEVDDASKMWLWKRILDTLIDPNIIALMLSLGVLGIVVELWNPGLIFPGAFGVLASRSRFYGLDVLPISWAGMLCCSPPRSRSGSSSSSSPSATARSRSRAPSASCSAALLLFEPAGSGYQVSLPVVAGGRRHHHRVLRRSR